MPTLKTLATLCQLGLGTPTFQCAPLYSIGTLKTSEGTIEFFAKKTPTTHSWNLVEYTTQNSSAQLSYITKCYVTQSKELDSNTKITNMLPF